MKSLVNDKNIGDIYIQISVHVTDNWEVIEKYNEGHIEIGNIFTDNKKIVCWDNLEYFLDKSQKDLKKECKQILEVKGLYEKGMFKILHKMLSEFVESGYLTKIQKI